MSPKPSQRSRDVLSVSRLTALVRESLEERFPSVTVEGEVSAWLLAGSGHAYFSIKDEGAVLGCVMWRNAAGRLTFRPAEGMMVECGGRLSVFDKRGQYQLLVDSMRLAGEGELWAKFQKLKARLEAEGLFDGERKRALPAYPRTVGVVTSPTGAVLRDILNVLGRRAPSVSILLYPARVQGAGAGKEIAEAVRRLGASGRADVMIVGRGGGSAEDLWEFNDEGLARAIFESPVPVVSAVGHETDFSISDFVADLRAPTPSAAAEIVSAGYVDLQEFLRDAMGRSRRATEARLRETQGRVKGALASHALRRPEMLLREYQQRADLALRRLPEVINARLERARLGLGRLSAGLEGHSPELILRKGYAIIRRAKDDAVLTSVESLKRNLAVDVELHDGKRRAVVTDDRGEDLFG